MSGHRSVVESVESHGTRYLFELHRGGRGAEQRGTSMRTVANQVRAVYQKVGVSSLGGLASRCVRSAIATRED